MNRIQFMAALEALLQDVPEEERREALQYYNDYFDEAGPAREEEIIRELGSPGRVAAEIKAGLEGRAGEAGEFRETGYTDARFEHREAPARQGCAGEDGGKPQSGRGAKILLIVLILLVGFPIIFPLSLAALCLLAGLAIASVGVFVAFLIAAVAMAVCGIAVFAVGLVTLVADLPAGLMVVGCGLLLTAAGAVFTVAAVRLCIIVLPGMFRFCVELLRRPFHRRKAVA